MILFVDIDGTICTNTFGSYELAKPFLKNIEKVNKLYDDGHKIVYWTARGSKTKIDWTDLTKKQLDLWGAKYHDLVLGKPHYDLYVDDKSLNSMNFFSN
tara:strand:+ start:1625 stop:1921 length:297 start_codon:yes stop_codon:yes gene_type:complete